MIMEKFKTEIQNGYSFKGDSIVLGTAMLEGSPVNNLLIKAPLKTFNRHGLICGATGSGKTKTLQVISESLSRAGVPILIMDIKGDISGLSQKGETNDKIKDRHEKIGIEWKAEGFPVEFLTLKESKGVRLRATVSEFGPVLFSKILGLNDNQSGVVSLVFKYCDDNGLPLLDLQDFKKMIQYLTNEGKKEIAQTYGALNTTSASVILRKVLEIEQQGADIFFGEPSFDAEDLLRIDENGKGYINILRLMDVQNMPKLFSAFMLCLLAEIYEKFPEEGDMDAPKLVIFIDEAHLIFEEASKTLLDQIETVIKLIRSKGVGVYFCTQIPDDVPESVLSQLGMKVQHTLRAFTAKDRKSIKLAAQNYPETEFYNVEDVMTSMGIGEALITVLNEKGNPTPLAHTLLCAPSSRMDVISGDELEDTVRKSSLAKKYNETVNRESAYEILNDKLVKAQSEDIDEESSTRSGGRQEKTTLEKIVSDPITRQIGRTVAREVTRGLLGALGLGSTRSRKRGLF